MTKRHVIPEPVLTEVPRCLGQMQRGPRAKAQGGRFGTTAGRTFHGTQLPAAAMASTERAAPPAAAVPSALRGDFLWVPGRGSGQAVPREVEGTRPVLEKRAGEEKGVLRSQPPTGTCGFNPKSYLWERERHRLTPSPAAREAGCLRRASISPGAGGRRAVTPHPSGLGSGTPSGGGRAGGHGARGRVSAHTCGHANALSSPTRPTRVLLSASFTDWEMRRRSGLPKCRARTLSQTSWLQGPC